MVHPLVLLVLMVYLSLLNRFTVCMVYYGLSLGVGSLSSNLYLAFTLSGLVEIPSNLLTLVALEKYVIYYAVQNNNNN